MATYVNNLRLTELATGEGSGTWGTTTNTNLELIGEALGYGSEAIANASTHTITVADGTADSARSFYLKLTGGGQACTVTLAPNTLSKVWMVENTTNSTLTFSQGSGANVAVPAGQVKMIATDGAGSGAVVYDLLVDTDLTGTTTVVNLTSSGTIDAATVEFDSLSGTGAVAVTDILDQDDMSSNSATALATQQSIKAYVDSSVASFDSLAEVLAVGNTTGGTDILVSTGDDITLADSSKVIFGDGSDLQIYHDGSNSYIKDAGTGGLVIQARDAVTIEDGTSGDNYIYMQRDSKVELFYAGASKLVTASGGISVAGEVAATSLDISGDIDVDGTTNLDVVDIDGAVDMAAALTVAGTATFTDTILVTRADNSTQLTLESTDADGQVGPRFDLHRNSASPAASDNLGQIRFLGDDSAGVTTSYAFINSFISSPTDGSESGEIVIETRVGGANRQRFTANTTETIINEDGADLDFRVESDNKTYMFYIDAGTDTAYFGGSDDRGFINIEKEVPLASNGAFTSPHIALQALAQPTDNDGFVGMSFATSDSDNYGFTVGAQRTTGGVGNLVFRNHFNDASGTEMMAIKGSSGIVFNEGGIDADFRVESNGNTYMLFVDGGNDSVSIGTSTQSAVLTIHSAGNGYSTGAIALKGAGISDTNYLTNAGGNFYISHDGTNDDFVIRSTDLVINETGVDRDFRVETSGNANMLFVDGGNNRVGIGTSSTSKTLTVSGDAIITTGDNSATLTLQSTDADANAGPLLVLDRNSSSPADGDVLGQIQFNGKNDAAEAHGYAKIEARIVDASNATEDGRLELMTSLATEEGVSRILMTNIETSINDNSKDLDFRVESNGNANMLFVDASTNRIGIGTSSPAYAVDIQAQESNNTLARLLAGTSGSASLRLQNDAAHFDLNLQTNDNFAIYDQQNGRQPFTITAGSAALVINEDSKDMDFRVESDGNANMLFVDASANAVNIGSIKVAVYAADTNSGYIADGGNVGIRFSQPGVDDIVPCDTSGADRDNSINFGSAGSRWGTIFAGTGTINTSDQNEKQDVAELSESEQRVAVAAKGLLRKFRWKESVAKKGDAARTHIGIMAQDLQAAFAAEGLDASDYAMWCSDTWIDKETGEERTRLGVRYSELLAFIISAI